MSETWIEYSGKPAGDLKVPVDKYVELDVDVPDPPFGGIEAHMLYVNVTPTWKITDKKHPDYWNQRAVLRTRYKRENGDNTAYNDRLISPHSPAWLITDGDHWETGQKGQGGKWWVKVRGDVKNVVISTRYCKTAVIR